MRNRTNLYKRNHPLSIFRNLKKSATGKIYYVGWLGSNNFGDEIIADIAQREMEEFWLQSIYPSKKVEDMLVEKFHLSPPEVATIVGGGTLIGGPYCESISSTSDLTKPLFTFGSGVVPVKNWETDKIKVWRDILRRANGVSVRGYKSRDYISNILDATKIYVVGDYALSASKYYPCIDAPSKRVRVGVNLGSHKLASDPTHNQVLHQAIKSILRMYAQDFEFIPLILHDIDKKRIAAVFDAAEQPTGDAIDLRKGPREVKKIGALDCVVSERLHGSILAHSYNVPAIGLAYDEKIYDHFDIMKQGDFCLAAADMNAQYISSRIRDIFERSEDLRTIIKAQNSELRKRREDFLSMMRSVISSQ